MLFILVVLILLSGVGGIALGPPYHYGSFSLGGVLLVLLLVMLLTGRL